VLKPACVLVGLSLGIDVLWMDTDIVLLESPLPYLYSHHYYSNLTIQAGGTHALETPMTAEEAFRSELCTGFYLVRSSPGMMTFFHHVILVMAMKREEKSFGDQSATNLILFQATFRGLPPLLLTILDPFKFVGGGVYFQSNLFLLEGQLPPPVMIHNNFIFGMDKKIGRFKEHGLWYEEELSGGGGGGCSAGDGGGGMTTITISASTGSKCTSGSSSSSSSSSSSTEACLSQAAHEDLSTGLRLEYSYSGSSSSSKRVVAVLKLGNRPWFPSVVLPRTRDYAISVSADLVVLHGDTCLATTSSSSSSGVESDFRTCATRRKLHLLRALLQCYDRVLLIDDTALIRR